MGLAIYFHNELWHEVLYKSKYRRTYIISNSILWMLRKNVISGTFCGTTRVVT